MFMQQNKKIISIFKIFLVLFGIIFAYNFFILCFMAIKGPYSEEMYVLDHKIDAENRGEYITLLQTKDGKTTQMSGQYGFSGSTIVVYAKYKPFSYSPNFSKDIWYNSTQSLLLDSMGDAFVSLIIWAIVLIYKHLISSSQRKQNKASKRKYKNNPNDYQLPPNFM